jgi:hypothetical protein
MQEPYVPPPAIGGWPFWALDSDALVGCMRGLGSTVRWVLHLPDRDQIFIVYRPDVALL